MKKKIVLAIGGVVAASILAFGIFYSNGPQGTEVLSADEISEKVTSEYPGEITEIEKETDLNHAIYEVELLNDGKVYGLKIDGSTAEILEIKEKSTNESSEKFVSEENQSEDESDELSIEEKTEKDADRELSDERQSDEYKKGHGNNQKYKGNKHHHGHEEHHANKGKGKHSSMHTVISVEEAKQIALEAFPGEIDDIDLEREDGRLVYEIEIERDDQEAEILIDAYTGEIIIMEIDED